MLYGHLPPTESRRLTAVTARASVEATRGRYRTQAPILRSRRPTFQRFLWVRTSVRDRMTSGPPGTLIVTVIETFSLYR